MAKLIAGKATVKQVTVPHARLLPWNILLNFRAIRKVKADVYHVTGDVHYLVLGLPARKTILTVHDCVFMYQSKGLKRWFLKYMFLEWPVRHSRIVTTISEQTRRDIIQFTKCNPGKVVVIPNPVDEKFTYQEKSFDKNCPALLFVGTAPHKNLVRVAEALQGIRCLLDIVGAVPASQKEILNNYRINFRESINISNEELVRKYASCDILLFPSTFEGFGLPIIEAQQSGRPVITSNIAPMANVAGQGACLVDPLDIISIRNGILRVIEDEDYRSCLVRKGFENVSQYIPEKIASQYLAQYNKIIA